MPTTTRASVPDLIPEILEEAVQGAFAGLTSVFGTSAVTVNNSMPANNPQTGQRMRGGDTITVPYFDTLGELEDVVEGSGLTAAELTSSAETSTVVHSGKMFEMTYWAQLATNWADPYAEAARQLVVATQRRADKGAQDAGATTPLVRDASGAAINYDAVIDAKLLWGDEQNDIVLMSVHSKVWGDLLKLKDAQGRPLTIDSQREGELPRFAGIPIKVSDRNTVVAGTPNTYQSLLYKAGSVAFWFQGAPRLLTDADISADTVLGAIHVYHTSHRYKRKPDTTRTGVVKLVTR